MLNIGVWRGGRCAPFEPPAASPRPCRASQLGGSALEPPCGALMADRRTVHFHARGLPTALAAWWAKSQWAARRYRRSGMACPRSPPERCGLNATRGLAESAHLDGVNAGGLQQDLQTAPEVSRRFGLASRQRRD